MKMLQRLWKDDVGFVVSAELVLIATIVVIGMIVGLTTVRDQVVQELADVAGAFSDVNQSYVYSGVRGHTARTFGSDYRDFRDFCDNNDDRRGRGSNCVNVNVRGPGFEER